MVIATSDSCNTLVTLDNGIKPVRVTGGDSSSRQCSSSRITDSYERTAILLPEDDFEYDRYDEDDCDGTGGDCFEAVPQNLYLPTSSPVDLYLRAIPEVMESADVLLANEPRAFTRDSTERILYVGQGEVGHAVPSQCDVMASDKATTCHILALRSTARRANNKRAPLVSLAHIDSATYADCIHRMIQQHKSHHSMDYSSEDEEKKEDEPSLEEETSSSGGMIDMDIHILGGFEDADGTSREISNFLLKTLARLAHEEQSFVCMTLRTCAVSSMNDSGRAAPIGRGLGLNLHTGQVFLAAVDRSVAGPRPELRGVRLWAGSEAAPGHHNHGHGALSLVHTPHCTMLSIRPFAYKAFPEISVLLQLPDSLMLQYTSTSPHVEEDDFCDNLRSTLEFMRTHKCTDEFGPHCDTPIFYSRVDNTNSWKLVLTA